LKLADKEELVRRLDRMEMAILPRVAIVGRPNVGKSTLFNRFVGKRKAITDPTPGVTRDPIFHRTEIEGRACMLIDTGGLTESREYLDTLITSQSLSTIEQADILVFVLDVTEVTPEDEEFLGRLRQMSDRIVLAVNKVDNEQRAQMVYEFYSLGFDTIFPISATHGEGVEELAEELIRRIEQAEHKRIREQKLNSTEIEELRKTVSGILEADIAEIQAEAAAEGITIDAEKLLRADRRASQPWDISIAILGQPNTGKSTLSNLLTGTNSSIVSEVAGTTRDVLEGSFSLDGIKYRLLDTAGIRRKNKVKEDLEYYSVTRAISAIEEAEVVFLMIDAEKGLSDQDKKIAAQVVKLGRGIILCVNKWDLLEDVPNRLQAVQDRINFLFPVLEFAPILPLSAKNGDGVKELLETATKIQRMLSTRVDTGLLNRKLKAWQEHTPPPSRKGFFWKVKYITQVSVLPMKFILFVNRKKDFPESYIGFIKNRIRGDFGVNRIPIQFEVRDSRRT
jgi:GTP-binding protein